MKLLSGKNLIMLIILIVSGCFAFAANAAFNEQINFQGKLTDSSDVNVVDGDYNFEFKLWSHATETAGGYLKWTETCTTTKITVANGLFSHLLGSVNALPDDIFNQTLWLEVSVGGTTTEPSWETLAPRKKIGAVPAAFEAKRLEGYTTSSFAILSENETISGAWSFTDIVNTTASSSSAILTVNQTGNGNLVDFQVASTSKFVIDNSGNVATGTWQATPIALTYGGTGGNSTSTARTNLGLAIGIDVQEYDTDLAAIAAGTWTGAESITILGTIATGTWNGSVVLPAYGGTGTGTAFTQGSIVFAGAGGVYAQNNSSFFWDNTNYRLGIGTVTPGQKLTVTANLSSVLNSGYFSTGNVLLSSLQGGMYFGRVGVKENIFGLTNYANTWTEKDSARQWNAIAMSSDGKIQTAVTQDYKIYNSTDYGNTWALVFTSAEEAFVDVAMSSDGKIQTAVATAEGRIYVSTDYGLNWSLEDDPRYWKSVAMSSDGKIQTAVDTGGLAGGGYIYISTDYGDNWATTSATSSWSDVAMSSDGKIQTATINPGEIYVSTDYGDNWATTSVSGDWYSVAMSSDGKIQTVVVYGGNIYVSYNYGTTWTEQASSKEWTAVAVSSDGKIQTATVNVGQIYVSTEYGTSTWTGNDSNRTWKSVAMSSDGKIQTAVDYEGYIYVSHSDSFIPDGKLGIGTTTPSSALDVYATTSSAILTVKQDGSGSVVDFKNATGTVFIINNAGNVGIATSSPAYTLDVYGTFRVASTSAFDATSTFSGRVGIGTTTPAYLLDVWSAATTTIRLGINGGADPDVVLIGGGTGKLTVGTLDPVYNVQGTKYATYMSGMTGIKEETTGNVLLTNGEYVIDFNNLEEHSDLYIFYRITDFGQNWNKLTVLLSAEGPGGAWYQKDPQNNRLIIYSQSADSVSYRLSAPRYDWQKWLNLSQDGEVQGLMVDEIVNDQYSQGTSIENQAIDSLNEESGFLNEFVQKIKDALASLGLFIENGIANIQEIVTEKLTAKKARLDKIEMVDQNTGEIYCTWIKDGEWVKEKGECDSIIISEPSSDYTIPTEIPSEEPTISEEETVLEQMFEEVSPETTTFSEEETLPESQ